MQELVSYMYTIIGLFDCISISDNPILV